MRASTASPERDAARLGSRQRLCTPEACMRRTPDIPPDHTPPAAVHATRGVNDLNRWSAYAWRAGVSLDQLSVSDRILATTENHMYEIVVTSPVTAAVLVRGG